MADPSNQFYMTMTWPPWSLPNCRWWCDPSENDDNEQDCGEMIKSSLKRKIFCMKDVKWASGGGGGSGYLFLSCPSPTLLSTHSSRRCNAKGWNSMLLKQTRRDTTTKSQSRAKVLYIVKLRVTRLALKMRYLHFDFSSLSKKVISTIYSYGAWEGFKQKES